MFQRPLPGGPAGAARDDVAPRRPQLFRDVRAKNGVGTGSTCSL